MLVHDAEVPLVRKAPPDQYDASYYAHHCAADGDVPYGQNQHWLDFFSGVAARIKSDIAPGTVLDVGCAHGLLVQALRDRGIEACGFDVSEYAVAHAREDVRPYCLVGDILRPIPARYDLITCIEVVEHLAEEDADQAIANLCQVTDDVLFSSTPVDLREETHVNVRPPEFWAEQFARHGFARDLGFDATFLAWWAMRFRKMRDPWHRFVVGYEREWWRLSVEARERTSVVLAQLNRISALEAEVERVTGATQASELERLQAELSQSNARLAEMQRELERTAGALATHRGSLAFQLATRVGTAVRRAAPGGTRRGRLLGAAARRALRTGASPDRGAEGSLVHRHPPDHG